MSLHPPPCSEGTPVSFATGCNGLETDSKTWPCDDDICHFHCCLYSTVIIMSNLFGISFSVPPQTPVC